MTIRQVRKELLRRNVWMHMRKKTGGPLSEISIGGECGPRISIAGPEFNTFLRFVLKKAWECEDAAWRAACEEASRNQQATEEGGADD